MKKYVEHGTFLHMKITPIICHKNTSTTGTIGGSLSRSRETIPNQKETFWFQTSVFYIEAFTPRSWRRTNRAYSFLEVQTMETNIEFFYLVAMARIMVVCLRSHRKSRRRGKQRLVTHRGNPLFTELWRKPRKIGFQEFVLFCSR